MTVEIRERNQKSVGSSARGFGGPDRYVAVVVIPDGVIMPYTIRSDVAKARGVRIIYCGEGYSKNCKTVVSALGKARAKAEHVKRQIENGEEV